MDENLEDLREEFLKNGGHEITDAITVIKFMLSKGFSRRPELDEDKLKLFLYSQRADRDISKGVDFKVALQSQHLAKAICAKFTAPEAKPASSVNAEVVEALQALLIAVCYKTPTVDFGTQKEPNPCYEARVPVQFVHDAHKALNSIKSGKDTKCS